MEWHWPWAFALLPLPWFVYRLLPAHTPKQQPLFLRQLQPWQHWGQQSAATTQGTPSTALWLAVLLWLGLVTALARPYQSGDIIELPLSGRDLMLVLDLSRSMEIRDMPWRNRNLDRLQAAKVVLNDFIDQRQGDRMGLVLFGSEAYLQVPLTFDARTVKTLLNEAELGLAGDQTAIGDAIGLTIKRLQNNPSPQRVAILLTDGANTAGEVDPMRAAELAASANITLYTIGFGADTLSIPGFFGNSTVNPSQDLDEDSLRAMAQRTGGQYFRARSLQELRNIYQYIDQLEPIEHDSERLQRQKNWFHWPLAVALLCAVALMLRTTSFVRRWQTKERL